MMEIIFVCQDCGIPFEKSEEKSTEDWEHYDTKCPRCGGGLKVEFKEDGE